MQHVVQRPVPELVDVPQLALAVEELVRVFAGERDRLGELPEELDDLCDVVVVFAVSRA